MNVTGTLTLLEKEVRRFLRVPGQTVLSPLVSTALYFVVFGYAIGRRAEEVNGLPYLTFIVPGLIFMGIANNAFLNTSSSLFIVKIQGTVVDLLVAPLGPTELLVGFVGGGMVRGLTVGLLTWAVAAVFTPFAPASPLATAAFLVLVSFTFAALGLLAGLWAEKFEQINFFPTFVMLPLTFLGGVFYAVPHLPAPWDALSLANPMVYMVDGLRGAMTGRAFYGPTLALAVLALVGAVTAAVAWLALRAGYKLKT